MRIAFSAAGNGWNEPMDTRFGRAGGFFVVDSYTKETSYIDNQANLDAGHGAGTSAAQLIVDAGVDVVVTREVGPKAGSVLKAAGIKAMCGAEGVSVKEAYDRFSKGSLQEQKL
jgi:predicted Fe-Mo cluster-binding NifX family protein